MSSAQIEVAAWSDLDRLSTTMGVVGAQLEDTVAYAVHWLCRPDGFAPSQVCVLSPLAEVMEVLAAGFAEAGRRYVSDWERVRGAVALARSELLDGDDRASGRSSALLAAVV